MTHLLIDFAKSVSEDAKRADDLRKAIDFLEAAGYTGAIKYAEVYWSSDLVTGGNSGSYEAANLVDRHISAGWSEIHHAVLTRAKEDLAAIERRYEPLLTSA